jgi:DNA-binding CsgD family transcriptional regulator
VLTIRGRDRELIAIGDGLNQARSGRGSVVLIEGGPGMGKSRLLDEVRQMGRRLAFTVGSGAADPGARAAEMGTIIAALCGGSEPVLPRSAARGLAAAPGQRYWMLREVHQLLEQAATAQPLLLCLDDIHWADSGTLSAMRTLPTWLGEQPICWVMAYRRTRATADLADALTHERACRLVLEPLNAEASRQIATDLLGGEPDRSVTELTDRAAGSPFELIEMLLALRDDELVTVPSGRAPLADAQLPSRVQVSMSSRLHNLSEPARRTATVAASLGRSFSVSALAAMLKASASSLLGPLEELSRANLLTEDGSRMGFWHDITREAVRTSVPASVRRALDRQAAEVLLAAGASPLEVAGQLAQCAEAGDEVAIMTLHEAATTLGCTEPGVAARLAQTALGLAPRRHPLRGTLTAQCASLLHASARPDEARALADAALRQSLPAEHEAEVRLSVAGMLALSPSERADAGRQALELDELSPTLRARHLARLAHNLIFAGEPEQARHTLGEARRAVQSIRDPQARLTLTVAEAGLAQRQGRFGDSLDLLDEANSVIDRDVTEPRDRLTELMKGAVLAVLDRVPEAQWITAEGIVAARRNRQAWALHAFETLEGRLQLRLGRPHEATTLLAARFTSEEAEPVPMDAAGVVALGTAAIHTGDTRLGYRVAEIAATMARDGSAGVRRHATWMLALQADARGELDEAVARIRALGGVGDPPLPVLPIDIASEIQLVRIAARAEGDELLSEITTALARRAQRNPGVRSLVASAAHCAGLAHADIDELGRAVELFEQSGVPLALASALEDLGVARQRRGMRADGREALERSRSIYSVAGAEWDVRRVLGRLRAVGVRRRPGDGTGPAGGAGDLTEAELAVARLVSGGLTNRQTADQLFISPHTVNTHLRHVFAKLKITSRVQLGALVDGAAAE